MTRLDAAGNVVWDFQYDEGATPKDYAEGITRLSDGTIVAAWRRDPFSGNGDRIVAIDQAGSPLWIRRYDGTSSSLRAVDVVARPAGGVLFSSYWQETDVFPEPWLVAMNAAGVVDAACPAFASPAIVQLAPGRAGGPTEAVPAGVTLTSVPGTVTVEPTQALLRSQCAGFGSPVAPPSEVSPPLAAQPLVFTSRTQLRWEDASLSGSDAFNLYRDDVANLQAGSRGDCFLSSIASPSATDTDLPGAGRAFFYLVTGRNGGGEGIMGHDSFGVQRLNSAPCP